MVVKRVEDIDLLNAGVVDISVGLQKGLFKSEDLVKAYLNRIEEVNKTLRAVIETNPKAVEDAKKIDSRRGGSERGILFGIPILLQDNIATSGTDMKTTAGTPALANSVPKHSATVVQKLKEAGAIILGKANVSEWCGFSGKGFAPPPGWSGRGGQTLNPFVKNGSPGSPCSGCAVSTAVGLCTASICTEIHGTIATPASMNNVVGFKPTVGLTSRHGVISLSSSLDSVGIMAKSVSDVAHILKVIAHPDANDPLTNVPERRTSDFTNCLKPDGLSGAKLCLPLGLTISDLDSTFKSAIKILEKRGATVHQKEDFSKFVKENLISSVDDEDLVYEVELKEGIEKYLKTAPCPGLTGLSDIVSHNTANGYRTKQTILKNALKRSKDETYVERLASLRQFGREHVIDNLLGSVKGGCNAIVVPTFSKAPRMASLAGYPIITVPLGWADSRQQVRIDPWCNNSKVQKMPFGIAFIGTAWSEGNLIKYAYDFEQAWHGLSSAPKPAPYDSARPTTQIKDVMRASVQGNSRKTRRR